MKRFEKRRRLWRWLAQLFGASNRRRRRLALTGLSNQAGLFRRAVRLEPLENRQLMASDVFLSLLGSSYAVRSESNSTVPAIVGSPLTDSTSSTNSNSNQSEGEENPEGESGQDLVAFAKALAASGTMMYGGDWCPFCSDQKRLFGDGAHHLGYLDVTNPDRTPNATATSLGITSYPTWIFPDNTRLEGVQTLATLSQRSGVAIPQSSVPYVEPIGNVSVGIGSPLYVPVDASHPGGLPLTITVTSDNPNLVTATVPTGNRSMKISTNFGDMTFQLFEDKAPRAAGRVIELAQDEFYDGLLFHRVIDGFVLQGGDPDGDGSGGSNLGNFDDQFNLDLQHNRAGVLSFAKSTDDTNNSQFFITEEATRFLDFNHSVFGQMTEGDWVRDNISQTATNSSDKPTRDIAMKTVTIFNDTENGLVFLKPTGTGTGTANITVSVSDGTNTTTKTFVATVVQDTANGAPFLNDIPVLQTTAGTSLNYTLTSQDAEGDPVVYSVSPLGSVTFDVSVNSSTGVVTVVPPANFTGQLQFRAQVRQTPSVQQTTQDVFDSQVVTVQVGSQATLALSLAAASDSGQSSTDGVTNATSLAFNVTGTTSGAIVEIVSGDQVVGTATANSATTQVTVQNVTTLGEGAKSFTARQRVNGQVNGNSQALNLTLDRTQPANLAGSVVPASANVGVPLSVNLNHPEENQGLRYALTGAPSGMTVNSSTGQLAWTPTQSQTGSQSFTVVYTDLAGNERQQVFILTVGQQPLLAIRLATVSTTGAAINSAAVGQQFKVQIYVSDLRSGADQDGVFAAGLDLAYDPAVVQPIATSPITHVAPYTGSKTGTVTSGKIVGLGALSETTTPLGPGERLFAEVTFTTLAAGNAGLRSEASTNPDTDVGLFGSNDLITPAQIQYGLSSFATGLNFQLVNDVYNFDEDSGQHTLNVLANDVPETGVVLTVVSVTTPSNGGTAIVASDGKSLVYTAAANFNGAETLTYTVQNAQGARQTATVTLQITDVNDPPTAANDSLEVIQNSAVNILNVLGNDTQGVDSSAVETLTVTTVTQGSRGGTVEVGTSGRNVRYTPVTGFTGAETFSYTISDGRGGTSTATVTVTVKPAVPPPTVTNDSFTLVEDAASSAFNVLTNDTPVSSSHTLTVTNVSASQNGSTIGISSDRKSILYQPGANFSGAETLTYTVTASDGGVATGQVTFNVTGTPDAPVAVNDTLTANSSSGTSTLSVLANDTDPDPGETATLTITSVTQPASGNGTIAISNDRKSLIYTPPTNRFEGSASLTYTITDTTGRTATANVQLTVKSYTPRKISGQLVGPNDTSNSLKLFNLALTGTDISGNQVNKSSSVGSNGRFEFGDLAPGNYQLNRPALPFMNDDGDTIDINSEIEDGDLTTNLVVSSALDAKAIDIRDFLGSTFRKTLAAAVNSSGAAQWIAPAGAWADYSNFTFQMNTADVVVTATNGSSQQVRATIPLTHALISVTTEDGNRLIRLRGNPSSFNFASTSTSTSTNT